MESYISIPRYIVHIDSLIPKYAVSKIRKLYRTARESKTIKHTYISSCVRLHVTCAIRNVITSGR